MLTAMWGCGLLRACSRVCLSILQSRTSGDGCWAVLSCQGRGRGLSYGVERPRPCVILPCLLALSFQEGTLRMNCLDCLDRTNTVQCFIALEVSSWGLFCQVLGCGWGKNDFTGLTVIGQVTGMWRGSI